MVKPKPEKVDRDDAEQRDTLNPVAPVGQNAGYAHHDGMSSRQDHADTASSEENTAGWQRRVNRQLRWGRVLRLPDTLRLRPGAGNFDVATWVGAGEPRTRGSTKQIQAAWEDLGERRRTRINTIDGGLLDLVALFTLGIYVVMLGLVVADGELTLFVVTIITLLLPLPVTLLAWMVFTRAEETVCSRNAPPGQVLILLLERAGGPGKLPVNSWTSALLRGSESLSDVEGSREFIHYCSGWLRKQQLEPEEAATLAVLAAEFTGTWEECLFAAREL